MSYRCINAFEFANTIYPGGFQVSDGHPILATHLAHFAKVDEPAAPTETASAAPGEFREVIEPGAFKEELRPRRGRPKKTTAELAEPNEPEGEN